MEQIRSEMTTCDGVFDLNYHLNEINAYKNEIKTLKDVSEYYRLEREYMLWIHEQYYEIAKKTTINNFNIMKKKIAFLQLCFIICFPIACLGQLNVKTSFAKSDKCFLLEIVNDKSNSDILVINEFHSMDGNSLVRVDFYDQNGKYLFEGKWGLGSETKFIIKENEHKSFGYKLEKLHIDLTHVYNFKVYLRIKYFMLKGGGSKLYNEKIEFIL